MSTPALRRGAGARVTLPAGAWALVALIAILAATAPSFLTVGNLENVSRTAAILALAASAQAIVIVTGGLDLSAGSAVGLMSVVSVLAVGAGTVPAFGAGVAVVLAIGVFNGLLVARFDIPPFLVTLGTLTGVHGLATLLSGGDPVEAPSGGAFSWPSNGDVLGVPVPLIIAVIGLATLAVILHRTTLGRCWYLVGSSPAAARAAGVRSRRVVFLGYVVGAVFLAVAAIMLTARVRSGQPNLQATLAFEAIAACAIGGFSLTGGAGSAGGVVVGVLVVSLTANGLRLLNLPSDVQMIAIGVITVAAVLGQELRMRRSRPASSARSPGTAQPMEGSAG
ncbi:MAG: ribose transport system permease protein [Solirubrobacteraceae bacterium]|nr:ribose transport system permease protein [Solirubrobacteraceae bacterium]